jgi:Sulfotransferase domain
MTSRPLTAILLRLLHGRVGSSLLMELLGTSEEIFFERTMPYERRYLASLIEFTRIESSRGCAPSDQKVDRKATSACLLHSLWDEFSAQAAAQSNVPIRYYAEKLLGSFEEIYTAGIPVIMIDVVRDPRDIYVSARAFAFRAAREMFGIRPAEPEIVNATVFLSDIAVRVESLEKHFPGVEHLLVRYEDMVRDLPSVAERLGITLGIKLDPGGIAVHRAHMTAKSVIGSIGRWRSELDVEVAALISKMLSKTLRRLNYPID